MKTTKTNAMRILDRLGIAYQMHSYNTQDGAIDGLSVAQKTCRSPEEVFKTLVAKGASGAVLVFCIPVTQELNLKQSAQAAGEKSLAMLPLTQVTPVTGYVRGGVSPIGMKKQYPTFIDASAFKHETIIVSGGRVGLQIEIAPALLAQVVQAKTIP